MVECWTHFVLNRKKMSKLDILYRSMNSDAAITLGTLLKLSALNLRMYKATSLVFVKIFWRLMEYVKWLAEWEECWFLVISILILYVEFLKLY